MTQPSTPKPNYRAEARAILASLPGSTRRDRVAFVAGFVMAFRIVANSLPAHEHFRLHAIATALHDMCAEDFR